MKKLLRIILGTSMTVPFITLPLICAKQNNAQEIEFYFGNDSSYKVKITTDDAHPDWGTFAEITSINLASDESVLKIPATVKDHDQIDRPVKRISTNNTAIGNNHSLRLLDLSEAKNLYEITEGSFWIKSSKTPCFPIYWVNFQGASSLTSIGKDAFTHQCFDCDNNDYGGVLNFVDTNLTSIGAYAFKSAANTNHNNFKAIVLPYSLSTIGIDAFTFEKNEATRMKFQKVYFNRTDPLQSMLINGNSMPMLVNKSAADNCIYVPYGSEGKYKNLDNLSSDLKSKIVTTKIRFNDNVHYTVASASKQGGIDETTWSVINNDTSKELSDVQIYLNNDYNGKIRLNEKNYIEWDNDFADGSYPFHISAYWVDHSVEPAQPWYISSQEIVLKVGVNCTLIDGSNFLITSTKNSGKDKSSWKVSGLDNVDKVYWSFIGLPTKLKDKVHILEQNNQAYVSWDEGIDVGTYTFTIHASAKSKTIGGTFTADAIIGLQVYQSEYGFNTFYKDTEQPYSGEIIHLSSGATTSEIFDGTITGFDSAVACKDQVFTSIDKDLFALSWDDPATKFHLDINLNPTAGQLSNGVYNFYLSYEFTEQSTGTVIRIYSDTFKVLVGENTRNINEIPEEVEMINKTAGSITIPVLDIDDNRQINTVNLNPAQWDASQIARFQHISASITEDKKSIVLSWDETFTEMSANTVLDYFDMYFELGLIDITTNDSYKVYHSLTGVIHNEGDIKYEGEQILLSYSNKTKTFTEPFTYTLNGSVPQTAPENLTFSCYVIGDDTGKYTDKIKVAVDPDDKNKAYLVCDQVEETEETLNGLKVRILATDADNLTYGYNDVTLYVGNYLELNIPFGVLNGDEGVAGESPTIITTWNGETLANPTYTLVGDPEGVSIKDNKIVWDETVAAGTYDIKITVTKSEGSIEHSKYGYARLVIKAKEVPSSTNYAAIIGGTVGGVAAAAGIGTGIGLGVKHSKAKKLELKSKTKKGKNKKGKK